MFGQCCFDVGDINCTLGTGTFIDINTGQVPHASIAGQSFLFSHNMYTAGWGRVKNVNMMFMLSPLFCMQIRFVMTYCSFIV